MLKKNGFSLLEVMISLLIFSVLIGAILQIYNQITNNAIFVKNHTDKNIQILIFYKVLKADFFGFTPIWFDSEEFNKKKGKEGEKLANSDTISKNKYFYSINKDSNFYLLTFVTTNNLKPLLDVKPNFVRVVYKLEKVENNLEKAYFNLFRKADYIVSSDIADFEKGEFELLLSNISSFEIDYFFYSKKEKESKNVNNDDLNKLSSKKEWGIYSKGDKYAGNNSGNTPDFLKIKFNQINLSNKKETTYNFKFKFIVDSEFLPKQLIESKEQEKQTDKNKKNNIENNKNNSKKINSNKLN